MKKLNFLFAFILVASISFFTACGGKNNDAEEQQRIQDSITSAFRADSAMKADRSKAVQDSLEGIIKADRAKYVADSTEAAKKGKKVKPYVKKTVTAPVKATTTTTTPPPATTAAPVTTTAPAVTTTAPKTTDGKKGGDVQGSDKKPTDGKKGGAVDAAGDGKTTTNTTGKK